MNGGMDKIGAFRHFYEEQARYAFRLIAESTHNIFLFDGWDRNTKDALGPVYFSREG